MLPASLWWQHFTRINTALVLQRLTFLASSDIPCGQWALDFYCYLLLLPVLSLIRNCKWILSHFYFCFTMILARGFIVFYLCFSSRSLNLVKAVQFLHFAHFCSFCTSCNICTFSPVWGVAQGPVNYRILSFVLLCCSKMYSMYCPRQNSPNKGTIKFVSHLSLVCHFYAPRPKQVSNILNIFISWKLRKHNEISFK